MDSKQTPNHPKPDGINQGSTGGRAKFSRPRSNRKQDGNATLSRIKSHDITLMGPSRSSHRPVRQNLNITLAGVAFAQPNIKSNISLPANGNEIACDLAYTDYLQALLKRQLVKKTIQQHEVKLNEQILIQTEQLHKLQNTFNDISSQIEGLNEQRDTFELLQTLKYGIKEIEMLCAKYNTLNSLGELNKILTRESGLVSIKNIKPVTLQEEYDELISSLVNLKNVMEKIVRGDKLFKEVNELSTHIKAFNELNNTVSEKTQKLSSSNKKAAVLILRQISDFFAQQGGYF